MKKQLIGGVASLFALVAVAGGKGGAEAVDSSAVSAARGVIARFAGEATAASLKLEIIPADRGLPVFEVADNGRTIRGSSPVAIAKGFYDNCRTKGAGIRTWSGKRFDAQAAFAPSKPKRVVSPYRYSEIFNVCTLGYSAPFWDERRWLEELDWMALHGVNMTIAQIANEAIAERVWKRYGLTDAEIDEYFCGPAYLPWFRMGNLSERPDRLPRAWRERSVRLQHAVNRRMRALGIELIAPGFAGFLPRAFARVRPEVRLTRLPWVSPAFGNNFLSPDQPVFRELAKVYVEEWEKEFGRATYYLADSFNEMKLPWQTEEEIRRGFAAAGANIIGGMREANPDAVWALQGWVFYYDGKTWTPERFAALQSAVPAEAMFIIDLSVDYIRFGDGIYGKPSQPMNWDKFPAFGGQPWMWSALVNMGGDTILGGLLDYYANGHLSALASVNRGQLWGYGLAPEGIENNEVIFELATEGAWRTEYVAVREWLADYSLSRYGKCPDELKEFWDVLLEGPYSTFFDHPQFSWQKLGSKGQAFPSPFEGYRARGGDLRESWRKAHAAFEACAGELGDSELYRADRAEVFAIAAGMEAHVAILEGRREDGVRLLKEIDRRLKGHPLHDLRRWIAFARAAAEGDEKLADEYESDARRIVTDWADSLEDYSARVWSGLVGTYYLGRMKAFWEAEQAGTDPAAAVQAFKRKFIDERARLD